MTTIFDTSPQPPPTQRTLLRRGSTGNAVRAWQGLLAAAGYSLTPDGAFGPLTETNTRDLQRDAGLQVDGIVGPATRAAAERFAHRGASGGLLSLGSRGPDVLRLQLLLLTRGVAAVNPTGAFDGRTRAGVAQAQTNAQLQVTGIADAKFVAALRSDPVVAVEVPRVRTVLSLEERRIALRAGHLSALRAELSPAAERMALAQLQLEHGERSLWTNNFGNVMAGRDFHGPWFAMDALERHAYGWQLHHSSWRAYALPEEGAAGYWGLLEEHFPAALAAFEGDDVERVVHELKDGHYMTAHEGDYAAAMRSIWGGLG